MDDPVAVQDRALARVEEELASQFEGVLSRETVARLVRECFEALAANARVRTYLPVLTKRFALERLQAIARVEGRIVADVPEVLFVCVHNAGRSQMAAAFLAHHGAGRVRVRSAGSAPADDVNPAVVEAMREVGIDLESAYPKPLTDEVVEASDVVITMGCGDACPVFPGKRYLDWQLADPAGLGVDAVRPIRDEIERRVKALLEELRPAA